MTLFDLILIAGLILVVAVFGPPNDPSSPA